MRLKVLFSALGTVLILSACQGLDTTVNEEIPNGFPNPNPVPSLTPTPTPPLAINGPFLDPVQPVGVISGTVQISATATGPAIAYVQFFANGTSIGFDTAAPFEISFNSAAFGASSADFQAKVVATDLEEISTPIVSYTIDNAAPTVSQFDAESGNPQDPPGNISGQAKLVVAATDNVGIARVDYYLDGTTFLGSTTQISPQNTYDLFFDSSAYQNGPHTLTAEIWDQTNPGNMTSAGPLNVSFSNGGAVISITSPVQGNRVSGVISVSATATDPTGVTELIFISPAGLVDTNPAPDIFQATFDTTTAPEGGLAFTARATNGTAKYSFLTVTPIVDNIPFDGAISLQPPTFTGADFGAAVSMFGDANNDGFADVALGSPNADHVSINDGYVVVFFGPDFLTSIPVANPEPTFGANFGFSLAPAGDVDGDGNDDLAVGAPGASVSGFANTGKVYIFKGPSFSAAQALIISNPTFQNGERFGFAVAGGGDVTGDGANDLIVGAPNFNGPAVQDVKIGRAYVVSGPTFTTFTPIAGPANQFDGRFGESAAILSDSNGNGQADYFAVGQPSYDGSPVSTFQNMGRVYVYAVPGTILATLSDPTPEKAGNFGASISTAGDINGDNQSDLLIGVPGASQATGEAFYALAPTFAVSAATRLAAPNGQAGDRFGISVCAPGDVDGSGQGDLLIGAPIGNKSYLFHGSGFGTVTTLTHPSGQPSAGFGASVSGGYDVNGDGAPDAVIGASSLSPSGGASVHFNN